MTAPPHSPQAESMCLGAAMLSGDAAEMVVSELRFNDFYVPAHRVVFDAISELVSAGHRAEPRSVALLLARVGTESEVESARRLSTLIAGVGSIGATKRYIEEVAECAARRNTLAAAIEITEMCRNRTTPIGDIASRAREMVGSVDMPLIAGEPDPTIEEFLAESDDDDWIVPGLLERGDRVIITGDEGYGKSTMLRQVAVCAAAGVHPFTQRPIAPVSVLIIDLENGRRYMRRALRGLTLAVKLVGAPVNPALLRVCSKPDGVELTSRTDVRWLYERMEADRPELLIIGPLYKLQGGSPIDEEPAAKAARALDTIRERWGVTIAMEAHAPHASGGNAREMRPYGASLWKRWPEFGLGIVPDKDEPLRFSQLKAWRGSREEREWPKYLQRGGSFPWTIAP